MSRSLIIVSGYYGFDNLGDEAILEEICNELKELVSNEQIVVLSANPQSTAARFNVKAIKRTDYAAMVGLCLKARLFISGGGGLFQNTRTLKSILFYGMQIMAARMLGSEVMIYAQGIGPLVGKQAEDLTRGFFRLANAITVRDDVSAATLQSWHIPVIRTADPVWRLQETPLPPEVAKKIPEAGNLIALSLRPAANFTDKHVLALAKLLYRHAPDAHILLLPLQSDQDSIPLTIFQRFWQDLGGASTMFDTAMLQLPSQWIGLFRRCRALVGMRLHAAIMAIKARIPVAGIAYDPKVTRVLEEFHQPCLILTKDIAEREWEEALKSLVYEPDRLLLASKEPLEVAENLSCQNFELLARILNMQRGG